MLSTFTDTVVNTLERVYILIPNWRAWERVHPFLKNKINWHHNVSPWSSGQIQLATDVSFHYHSHANFLVSRQCSCIQRSLIVTQSDLGPCCLAVHHPISLPLNSLLVEWLPNMPAPRESWPEVHQRGPTFPWQCPIPSEVSCHHTDMQTEGCITGFDKCMTLILDDTEEIHSKTKSRKLLGRLLLKGDNITLLQSVSN